MFSFPRADHLQKWFLYIFRPDSEEEYRRISCAPFSPESDGEFRSQKCMLHHFWVLKKTKYSLSYLPHYIDMFSVKYYLTTEAVRLLLPLLSLLLPATGKHVLHRCELF